MKDFKIQDLWAYELEDGKKVGAFIDRENSKDRIYFEIALDGDELEIRICDGLLYVVPQSGNVIRLKQGRWQTQ